MLANILYVWHVLLFVAERTRPQLLDDVVGNSHRVPGDGGTAVCVARLRLRRGVLLLNGLRLPYMPGVVRLCSEVVQGLLLLSSQDVVSTTRCDP